MVSKVDLSQQAKILKQTISNLLGQYKKKDDRFGSKSS